MQPFRRTTSLLATAGIAAILAGCSSQGGGSGNSPAASNPVAGGSAGAAVVTVQQGTLGSFLAGANGKTLYILTRDSAGTSTCTGTCATTWPAFILDTGQTVSAGAGVTAAVGSFQRADGKVQVSLDGQPLYYFSGDSAAGDTKGQGTNGVWFVAAPGGGGVGAPAVPSPSSGGYTY
jgi:predicted lipoprotein with Yx(FWY)xxD motif